MIEAESLTKDYGRIRAANNISFTVQPGEILGFLGPNGAGKSTTMKMIAGFLPPTAGRARIGGHDVWDEPIAAKQLLGYLPENGPIYEEMTAYEFLLFIARIRNLEGEARTTALDRVIDICHLEGVLDQTIDTLSKGFRQRVGLAQAILHDPRCLILDEPTDGLDPNQKREVRDLIASMTSDKAIILSTHILEEVEAMCNRVIIIANGKIVADQSPDELLRRHPKYGALRVRVGEGQIETAEKDIGALESVASISRVEGALEVIPRNGSSPQAAILELSSNRDWKIGALEPVPARLDEVFYQLTRTQDS